MKRFLTLLAIIYSVAILPTCTSTPNPTSTPTSVAKLYAEGIMNQDFETVVDLYYYETSPNQASSTERERLLKMFKESAKPNIDRAQGIKSYGIGIETIGVDNNSATVEVKFYYNNESSTKQRTKLKCVDGKWYMSL